MRREIKLKNSLGWSSDELDQPETNDGKQIQAGDRGHYVISHLP